MLKPFQGGFFLGAGGTWGKLVSKLITSHMTCSQGATLFLFGQGLPNISPLGGSFKHFWRA